MSPDPIVTRDQRIEAGRTVYRLLREHGGWMDRGFIGWMKHPTNYIDAGLDELFTRGLIEERFDTKRPQVRLLPKPRPVQTTLTIEEG